MLMRCGGLPGVCGCEFGSLCGVTVLVSFKVCLWFPLWSVCWCAQGFLSSQFRVLPVVSVMVSLEISSLSVLVNFDVYQEPLSLSCWWSTSSHCADHVGCLPEFSMVVVLIPYLGSLCCSGYGSMKASHDGHVSGLLVVYVPSNYKPLPVIFVLIRLEGCFDHPSARV